MLPGWALIAVSFGFPLLLLLIRDRAGWKWLNRLNPIIVCYIAGILLANTGLVGERAAGALDLTQTAAVALSIPLLLFSVDLAKSRTLTGRAGLSMVLASVSIVIVVTAAHLIFRERIPESAKIAGMVVGVYTGGTPNLAAISRALNVSQSAYLTVHTADLVLSAIYLLFVITIAKKVLSRVLPAYRPVQSSKAIGPTHAASAGEVLHAASEEDSYSILLRRSSIKGILISLALAVVVAGLGGSVFLFAPEGSAMVLTILTLTTLSLAASFIPGVRQQQLSYPVGQFLILVFCVSVGALADLKILLQAAPSLFLFVGFCLFGSFLLHILLARVFRVDTDTLLVTSTSAICSPPFVGLTAAAIGNRDMVAPGITTGILGHAVGNYLGVAAAGALGALF
ncbi:MAG: DUF819 family protein [Spirochaetaceae bacterium]|nr:DUF819 family protein [Spirochaetaceae bacterium]